MHPRVCGGSGSASEGGRLMLGASPRVRGKLISTVRVRIVFRCIPACAGEAAGLPLLLEVLQVHPRVCGGSGAARSARDADAGASPRVRGKRGPGEGLVHRSGCIPACAGEAIQVPHGDPGRKVHPRVCGGSLVFYEPLDPANGASPRVRGKRYKRIRRAGAGGCIPACAGEATVSGTLANTTRVHPRVCGGSRRWLRGRGFHQVHPRVCGGSWCWVAENAGENGASPRVRGKLPHRLE